VLVTPYSRLHHHVELLKYLLILSYSDFAKLDNMPNFSADLVSCKGGVFQIEIYFSPLWYSYIEYAHHFNHPIVNEIDIQKFSITFCFKTSW